jgi:hypothetical protein
MFALPLLVNTLYIEDPNSDYYWSPFVHTPLQITLHRVGRETYLYVSWGPI